MHAQGLIVHAATGAVAVRVAVHVWRVIRHPDPAIGKVALWASFPTPRPGVRCYWLFLDEPANRARAVQG